MEDRHDPYSGESTHQVQLGKPSVRELNELAQNLAGCWHSVAIELGLDIYVVDSIDFNNVAYPTPVRKAFRALVEWHNEFSHDARYERLAEALTEVGRDDLARKFCFKQVNRKSEDTHAQYERKQSSGVPSLVELDDLSNEVVFNLESLGRYLGVDERFVENIVLGNVSFPAPNMKAFEVLRAWREMGSTSTYQQLAQALRDVNLGRLADRYCGKQSEFGVSSDSDEEYTPIGDTSVPVEIQFRGSEALRAYRKALKDGKTRDRRVPVMIIGRSGKTSLKKSLKGEKFDPDESSTVGIEVDPSLFHLTTEIWRPKESVESTDVKFDRDAARLIRKNFFTQEKLLHSTEGQDNKVAKANAHPAPEFTPEREFPETKPERDFTLPEKSLAKAGRSLEKVSTLPKEVEKLLLNPEPENAKIDEDPKLVLWDFAGQSVFYTTHVLFMSRIAIYILTHDLSRDLHAKAEPRVKCDMYERVLSDKECELTNMDYIHYWLSSIHAFSSNSDSSSSESEDLPSKLPAVFLVCTHADKCKNSREVAMEILSNLEGKVYEDHVVQEQDPFTVDNTKSGSQEGEDEVFKRLRDKILKAAYQLPHMMEFIPLSWLLLEKFLKRLQADGANLTSLDTARATAKEKCDIQDEVEFRVVITYLHDRHAVLHFSDTPELDRLVVLNHQWLIDIFKKIITVQPRPSQKLSFRLHWKALETQGVLKRELVEHVWKDLIPKQEITGLLHVLQKFSLACRWTQPNGAEVYLVPSMLMTAADSKILELIASAEVPALFVRFPDQCMYVPFGLFPRLVTRCVNWCGKKWSVREQPQFFRNYARFFLGTNGTYQVILASRMNVVSFSVVRGEDVTKMSDVAHKSKLKMFCRAVIGFVKQTLQAMQEEHLWLKFMKYIICVECPVCSKGGVRSSVCDLHHVTGCKQDQCLHYISEDELLHRPEPLVCSKSGDAKRTGFSKELFTPWFESLDRKTEEKEKQKQLDGSSQKVLAGRNMDPKKLRELSKELIRCWKDLGYELGVDRFKIEEISMGQGPPSDKAHEMLMAWSDNCVGDSQCSILITALRKVKQSRLADDLERAFDPSNWPVEFGACEDQGRVVEIEAETITVEAEVHQPSPPKRPKH